MRDRDPLRFLEAQGAQRDVLDGLSAIGADWHTLWHRCMRGDWLLGIAGRLDLDHGLLVRAAAACATTALVYTQDENARRVIDQAQAWSRGETTAEEVADLVRALEASSAKAVDPSSEAACRAALAVGMGIAERDVLASAAAAATEATVMASLDCGFEMAMRFSHAQCADRVRAEIPWEIVAARVGT